MRVPESFKSGIDIEVEFMPCLLYGLSHHNFLGFDFAVQEYSNVILAIMDIIFEALFLMHVID